MLHLVNLFLQREKCVSDEKKKASAYLLTVKHQIPFFRRKNSKYLWDVTKITKSTRGNLHIERSWFSGTAWAFSPTSFTACAAHSKLHLSELKPSAFSMDSTAPSPLHLRPQAVHVMCHRRGFCSSIQVGAIGLCWC